MKKIIDYLYLGSRNERDIFLKKYKNNGFIISCAEEDFENEIKDAHNYDFFSSDKFYYQKNDNLVYFNFKDEQEIGLKEIKKIKEAVNLIENLIKKQKFVYIHCLFGVNRSPSIVFVYLVAKKIINSLKLIDALNKFRKIYPHFAPNKGWLKFLKNNFSLFTRDYLLTTSEK